MPKLRKVDGAWRSVSARYKKVDGQWRRVKESYRKVDGIWVKTFGSESIYIQPIINNPVPHLTEAGSYFDYETRSWRVYINGRPSSGNIVDVSLKIMNIPSNSRVSLALATYDGLTGPVTVNVSSNGTTAGSFQITNSVATYQRQSISSDLSMIIRLSATSAERINLALYDVKINDVPIPLP